jgi:hypothetical protein
MNNIQEKDWAEDDWHGHTGIDSSCDYCIVNGEVGKMPSNATQAETGKNKKDGSDPELATSTA